MQVAEDAARHGFREIQFDYVRFPSDGPISQALYPGEYSSKEDAIAGFLGVRPRSASRSWGYGCRPTCSGSR